MGSWAQRTCSKAVARGPGRARLQLAGEAAAGRPYDRPHNPGFLHGEINP